MKNIAVIGGTGFIGINLIRMLQSDYDKVFCISNNQEKFQQCAFAKNVTHVSAGMSKPDMIAYFKNNSIKYLVDLAYTTVPKTSFDDPLNDISSNLITTVGTFEWAKEIELEKLIWISTGGAIYGQSEHKLINESHPVNPISPYGITKLAIEKYAYMYYKLFQLPIVCLRPSNAFGPYQIPFRGQGFIATAVGSILQNKTIQLYGKEGTVRDYIYIDDLCNAIVVALHKAVPGEVYNIGTGLGINNLDILNELTAFSREINIIPEIKILESRPFDVNYNVLDASKFMKHTQWKPTHEFHEALASTWNWYLNKK